MVRETTLSADNFMYPLFVAPGSGVRKEIASLPGQFHLSVDQLAAEAEQVAKLGIPSVLLFGLPEKKDEVGSEAWHPEGVVQKAIRTLKKAVPQLTRRGGRLLLRVHHPRPLRRAPGPVQQEPPGGQRRDAGEPGAHGAVSTPRPARTSWPPRG